MSIFTATVKRKVMPENVETFKRAMRLAERMPSLVAGEVFRSKDPGDIIFLFTVFGDFFDKRISLDDGTVIWKTYRDSQRNEGGAKIRKLDFVRNENNETVCALPLLSEEDARRLEDLVNLRGAIKIDEARCLSPSMDPEEAERWLLSCADISSVTCEDGKFISLGKRPRAFELDISYLGGNCPVQADGFVGGEEFYYRARGEAQSFEVGNGFSMSEPFIGPEYAAGWIDEKKAREFIIRASLAYERALA